MKFNSYIAFALMGIELPSFGAQPVKSSEFVCPEGQHWVRAHNRHAYLRADGTSVAATHVVEHCASNPPDYAKWKERVRADFPRSWIRRGESGKPWTVEEAERLLEALSHLPDALLVDSMKSFFRAKTSSLYNKNPASGGAGEIVLYNEAFAPKQNLARILAHEFAHELYRQLPDIEKEQYRRVADWLLIMNPKSRARQLIPNRDDGAYVEGDGRESMTEDFSNNIEYFLFDPRQLESKTPKVYRWIKDRFGDSFKLRDGVRR